MHLIPLQRRTTGDVMQKQKFIKQLATAVAVSGVHAVRPVATAAAPAAPAAPAPFKKLRRPSFTSVIHLSQRTIRQLTRV